MGYNSNKFIAMINPNRLESVTITTKNIVAGFPGVGKSTAAKKFSNIFIDMESSDYHWIIDDDGNKTTHPDWPDNYVNAICNTANSTDTCTSAKFVLISTHKEVLDELGKRGIYFEVHIPKTADYSVELYKNRGSSQQFIDSIKNNFDKYIEDIKQSTAYIIYIGDCFITDIFYNHLT